MNEKSKIFSFGIFLAAMIGLFRYCSGPFYFGNNSDPSYFYLYNFLYILDGKSPDFVDHPGTTLDILGALVVKIFFSPHQNTPWLVAIVPQAEYVLGLVWLWMIVLYIGTFILLGLYALKKSQDGIFTGLVLVSSLWLIMVRGFDMQGVLPISAHVNSDTMMMTAVNLMLLAILRFYFSPRLRALTQALILGLAVAFAIATKFTALPFLFMAFYILESSQQRILLLAVTTGGFFLLTCPIWGSYAHLISWVKGLIMNRGMHGSGGEGFDAAGYFSNLIWIVKSHWLFVAGWLWAGTVALKNKISIDPKIRRILLGLAMGGLAQLIIVAKQPSYHYMAPMIGVSSLGLAFLYKAFPEWWQRGLKFVVILLVVVSLSMMTFSLWLLNENTRKTKAMLATIASDYASDVVCPFYRSSTPGFSFVFWNRVLNREDYSTILKTYYPSLVYYDIFGQDFKNSAQQIVPLAALKLQSPHVLIYGADQDPRNFEPYLTVKKIYTNGGTEALFEVISQRSKRGIEYLQFAMILYSQGHFEDAFKAAVISQQLGVGQDISGFIEILRQRILSSMQTSKTH